MTTQYNIRHSVVGGWVVECRVEGDNRWTSLGYYDTEAEARKVYNRFWRPS